jgi:hypothetical protein
MARVRWRGGGSDTYAADRVGTVGPNRVPRLAPMYCTEYRGWRLWYRTEYRKTTGSTSTGVPNRGTKRPRPQSLVERLVCCLSRLSGPFGSLSPLSLEPLEREQKREKLFREGGAIGDWARSTVATYSTGTYFGYYGSATDSAGAPRSTRTGLYCLSCLLSIDPILSTHYTRRHTTGVVEELRSTRTTYTPRRQGSFRPPRLPTPAVPTDLRSTSVNDLRRALL